MYLSELKLWNFRKYGRADHAIDLTNPNLVVSFKKGLNVLVGENDSGKTAIIDAIKLVLRTHAIEWIRIEDSDFYNDVDSIRIELTFTDFSVVEASRFTEWLSWDATLAKPFLHLIFRAQKIDGRINQGEVTAGPTEDGKPLNIVAREYLKCTYLKALRDADSELTAKKNSRISQILQGHELFKKEPHEFEGFVQEANDKINTWFNDITPVVDDAGKPIKGTSHQEQIKGKIDKFLKEFINDQMESQLSIADPKIKSILDSISIAVKQYDNLGLGTMNRLYMATELLHLNNGKEGLHLCLIEELEAHLHPQAQMKVICSLQNHAVQFILSTHSPNLTSKVKLSDTEKTNFIMCHDNDVYPLNTQTTRLDADDFRFLDNFLDVTKSNLFYAKGVILVEGWTEEILIPMIAEKLDMELTANEVSVVNVGSTAYLRYANIFVRTDEKKLDIPVSIVTDLDISPEKLKKEDVEDEGAIEYAEIDSFAEAIKVHKIKDAIALPDDQSVSLYLAPHWTLEWCLFLSPALNSDFMECVSKVHSKTNEFKNIDSVCYKDNFKKKLIEKLKNRTLDKVAIAQELSERIRVKTNLLISESDPAYYLVNAIKHACKK